MLNRNVSQRSFSRNKNIMTNDANNLSQLSLLEYTDNKRPPDFMHQRNGLSRKTKITQSSSNIRKKALQMDEEFLIKRNKSKKSIRFHIKAEISYH